MTIRGLATGVLALALLGFCGAARGQEFVKPGDNIILELPLENEDTSTATAQGARIVATFEEVSPASLTSYLSIDAAGSTMGPLNIAVGATNARTFRIKVVLAGGAPDGSFKVHLHPTFENADAATDFFASPDPDTLDTSVIFKRSSRLSVVNRLA